MTQHFNHFKKGAWPQRGVGFKSSRPPKPKHELEKVQTIGVCSFPASKSWFFVTDSPTPLFKHVMNLQILGWKRRFFSFSVRHHGAQIVLDVTSSQVWAHTAKRLVPLRPAVFCWRWAVSRMLAPRSLTFISFAPGAPWGQFRSALLGPEKGGSGPRAA